MKLFKNFKEVSSIKTNYAAEALSGGTLLGVRGPDFVCFYDWGSGKVYPRALYCSCQSFAFTCNTSAKGSDMQSLSSGAQGMKLWLIVRLWL